MFVNLRIKLGIELETLLELRKLWDFEKERKKELKMEIGMENSTGDMLGIE